MDCVSGYGTLAHALRRERGYDVMCVYMCQEDSPSLAAQKSVILSSLVSI